MTTETRPLHLYEIAEAYSLLEKRLSDGDENPDEWHDALDTIADEFSVKARAVAKVIRNFELTAETYDLEARRMAEAAQTHRKRAKWLSDYLRIQMQAMGIPKIPGAPTITLIKNSRPSVLIAPHVTTDDLPDAFTRSKTVVEIDKAALTAAYDRGEELPGGISVEDRKSVV